MMQEVDVSSDEKLWAGLNYAGWILCCGLPISSVVIYFMKREESEYVAFQSLQAIVVGLLMTIISFSLGFGGGLLGAINPTLALIMTPISLIFSLLTFAALVFGMFMTFTGREFQLPVIGEFVIDNWMGGKE